MPSLNISTDIERDDAWADIGYRRAPAPAPAASGIRRWDSDFVAPSRPRPPPPGLIPPMPQTLFVDANGREYHDFTAARPVLRARREWLVQEAAEKEARKAAFKADNRAFICSMRAENAAARALQATAQTPTAV